MGGDAGGGGHTGRRTEAAAKLSRWDIKDAGRRPLWLERGGGGEGGRAGTSSKRLRRPPGLV